MDFLRCLAFGFLPLLSAKGIEGCGVLIRAAVPTNQVERRDRDVEFGLIGVFESQEFVGLSLCGNSLQTSISTHAMLKMHNGIIHVQFR